MGHTVTDEERCKGCELCIAACPKKLIVTVERINGKGYHPAVLDQKRVAECTGCALCARMCPDAAITVYR